MLSKLLIAVTLATSQPATTQPTTQPQSQVVIQLNRQIEDLRSQIRELTRLLAIAQSDLAARKVDDDNAKVRIELTKKAKSNKISDVVALVANMNAEWTYARVISHLGYPTRTNTNNGEMTYEWDVAEGKRMLTVVITTRESMVYDAYTIGG